ncbi:MAG: hypothetical protein JST38_19425, partial [Bacteroidetes bacterium]|nr:hypothetical protein [Bacteroidota bacterium]
MKNRNTLNNPVHRGRWRAGLTALAFAGWIGGAWAQTANQYTFAVTAGGNLDPMSGATVLIGSGQDDLASAVTGIGFSFDYEGVGYTDFSVSSNGGMSLGATQITAYSVDNISDGQYNPKIMAFMADGSTSTGNVSTVLVGSSPNQVRVIQWNTGVDYSAPAPNCLFQVWLHETTNVVEFHYGTGNPTGYSAYWWAGISGATGTNYLNIRPGPTASNSDVTRLGAWPGSDQVFSFTPPSANCSTPTPGNTNASPASLCPGMATALSIANPEEGPGISRQWQSSPDGSTWTDINGATSTTYNSGPLGSTTWFRCAVTCSSGPSTVNSNPVQVVVSSPAPSYYTYAGTQFTETFTNWTNRCSTNDVPTGGYWANTPAYGPGSWRSSTTTAAESGWPSVSGWNYPQNTWADAPMARFHNRSETPAGTMGTLDFYVDMTAAIGGEKLRFDYINGGNTILVQVSTDGGVSFSTLATINGPYGSFQAAEYTLNTTSATTVIRIKSTAIGGNNNDTGIDNFRIVPVPTCAAPTSPTATATAPGSVDIGWTCTGCTGNYYVEYGAPGFTLGTGTVAGPYSGSPATISGLANGSYQAYVRQDCGGNGLSENAGPVSFNLVAGDFCANAIDISALGLPADDSSNPLAASTTGAQNDYATSACGSQPGPDVVLYHDVEPGASLRFTPQSTGKLSIAIGGSCPGTTSLACTAGGYLTLGPNVVAFGQWGDPTFLWTNNGCSTERVYVMLDGSNANVYMWNYAYTPPGGPFCAVVNGVTVNTVNTGTGATVSWPASCSGNVIVEYGPAGFTPGIDGNAGGGTVVAVNGTSTTLSGLTLDQAYDVYVRQDCGSGVYSANSTATPFTLHNGDDCSRVIALSGASGSMTINTTGANNDADFCNVGATGGDLILSFPVANGYGIYFTSAPTSPYIGHVTIGAGITCPGSTVLYCNPGAADYFWVNTTGSTVNVYFVQDGSDEGVTGVNWNYLPACAFVDSDNDGINDCDDLCPNFPGQEGDPCMNNGNPGIITGCQCVTTCNGNEVVVNITVDYNALDLSWQITDAGNAVIASEALTMADDNTNYSRTVCLGSSPADACYGFKLMDSYGDGLSGMGNWELRTTSGKVLLRDDFATGSSTPPASPASPAYGSVHSFCLPEGPANIAATECGIFNNGLGNKVYCNKVTGATQYQFEFSDPDAGFMRRIAVNQNYVIFSQMVANPLIPGVKYFARVRSNVSGPVASAHWGSGCEMGLGVPQVVVCSGLIPAPNYGHSCNETRAFNPPTNNSFIYATPVVGGTE